MSKIIKLGYYMPSEHNASSVIHTGGVAPTVMENHGTVTAILVEEDVDISRWNTIKQMDKDR